MKQQSPVLGQPGKRARRREFLGEMERLVPWEALVALVSQYMPEGRRGRRPFTVEARLRIHYKQRLYLSDPAMEDALHAMPLARDLKGVGDLDDRLPDESTTLRHLLVLAQYVLAPQILKTVNDLLQHTGLLLKTGAVVDVMLIAAPISTKNTTGEPEPWIKPPKKGNQFYFGMTAHIGTGAESGLVHMVRGRAGDVNDVVEANGLLHGEETETWGDAGYQGAAKRPEAKPGVRWNIALRPGMLKQVELGRPSARLTDELTRIKANIQAMLRQQLRLIKRQLGHVKVRYRGLANNTAQLHTLFALANQWIVHRRLRGAEA